jgi:hypothetical protein
MLHFFVSRGHETHESGISRVNRFESGEKWLIPPLAMQQESRFQ